MPAAIDPRQTPGWYDVMLGAGCAIVVHLLASWLLLRPAPAVPVEMPRIVQINLVPAPLQTQPPAAQPLVPPATPAPPKPPQAQRRPVPKVSVARRAVRAAAQVEPSQPAPRAIASTTVPAPPTAIAAPAPTTAGTAPIETVTEPRFDAAYLNNPTPAYPPLSRRLREQGRVLMRVYVDPHGAPAQVQVRQSSGHRRLDSAAESAVRRWRFVPARRGSDAIGAWVLVPISFSLRS